jgi:hypothetical protein
VKADGEVIGVARDSSPPGGAGMPSPDLTAPVIIGRLDGGRVAMLQVARRSPRRDPVGVACRLHAAAVTRREQGRFKAAQSACRRSLRILEQTVGTDHPDVANVLNSLAGIVQDLGEYARAEAVSRRSVGVM